MAVLYSNFPSVAGGPSITHTVEATATRVGDRIDFWVRWTGNKPSGMLNTTDALNFHAQTTYKGKTYGGYEIIKGAQASTSSPYTGAWITPTTISRTVVFSVPGVGDVTSLALTCWTNRTGGDGLAGEHSYPPVGMSFPAATAPGMPTLALDKDLVLPGEVLTLTVTPGSIGSGSLAHYAFLFSKNDGAWIEFHRSGNTSCTFNPLSFGAVPGDLFKFKVGVTNTAMLTAWSAVSDNVAYAATPNKMNVRITEGWGRGDLWVRPAALWLKPKAIFYRPNDVWKKAK